MKPWNGKTMTRKEPGSQGREGTPAGIVLAVPYLARGRASCAGLDMIRADVLGYSCGKVPPASSSNGRLIMRRIIPALCAIVMLTAFMVPTLAVADADTDAILGRTCPEKILEQMCLERYGCPAPVCDFLVPGCLEKWSCEGPVKDGKRHGNWVMSDADGDIYEGPLVDDKMHGNWVIRYENGWVYEGPYVDGKKHGNWVIRSADGTVEKRAYKDGKKHGYWVIGSPDLMVEEGSYVNGKKHGNWVTRYADGDVHEGPYVHGKKHGNWIIRWASGGSREGRYKDGEKDGNWVTRQADGRCYTSIWSADRSGRKFKDSC